MTVRVGVAAVLVIAAVVRLAYPRNLIGAFDTYYATAWGRQAWRGELPDFEVIGAATPHPLTIAVQGLLALPGEAFAMEATRWLGALLFGAFVVGMAALGWGLAGRWCAAAAGLLAATSPSYLDTVTTASADAWYLVLVVAAAALFVGRPGAPRGPAVLLAVAGLARPEAWALGGALWLWIVLRERRPHFDLLALVAAAPVVWAAMDLAVTGDPLHSLLHTREGADALGRPTGLGNYPDAVEAAARTLVDRSELVAAAVGVAVAVLLRRRVVLVPVALAGLGLLGLLVLAVAELSLLPRYLLVTGAMVMALAAFGLTAWIDAPRSGRRGVMAVGAGICALAFLVQVPGRWDRASDLAQAQRVREHIDRDLRALLDDPAAGRCGPPGAATFAVVPPLAFHSGRDPADVPLDSRSTVVPANPDVAARYYATGRDAAEFGDRIARTPSWEVRCRKG